MTTTWKHTADLSDAFFAHGEAMAKRLGAAWLDVLGVMFVESGVRASQPNLLGSGAVGLIQFTPDTLRGLGWRRGPDSFQRLSAEAQLPWVERFFSPYRGNLDTLAGVYCAVWMPADLEHRHEANFVLSAKNGRRGWAFDMNAGLDANGDLRITVDELTEAVRRGCSGSRWNELLVRAGQSGSAARATTDPDLGTTAGLQTALATLGFDPGPLDGIAGPRTVNAVRAFQGSAGLAADGRPGPLTRAALLHRLAAVRVRDRQAAAEKLGAALAERRDAETTSPGK